MGEARPRVTCPVCGRDVALTARTRVIGPHGSQEQGYRCDGTGRSPCADVDPALIRMSDLINNLDQYIEARALELIAESEQPITAVLEALAERYPDQVATWIDDLIGGRT